MRARESLAQAHAGVAKAARAWLGAEFLDLKGQAGRLPAVLGIEHSRVSMQLSAARDGPDFELCGDKGVDLTGELTVDHSQDCVGDFDV